MNATEELNVRDIIPIGEAIFTGMVTLLIVVVNSFLLISLWKVSEIRKQHPNTVLLIALITIHWLIGTIRFLDTTIPFIVNVQFSKYQEIFYYSDYYYRLIVSFNYSLLILMLVDRLLAVKKPFLYQTFTHKYAWVMLFSTFILPGVYSVLLFVDFERFSLTCIVLYSGTGFFLVVGNLVIFFDVHKQLKKIRSLTTTSVNAAKCETQGNDFKRRLRKSIMVSLLFTSSFCLLWIPFAAFSLVNVISGDYSPYHVKFPKQKQLLRVMLMDLGCVNSIIDPLIYVLLNRPIRNGILKMIGCRRKLNNNNASKTTPATNN